MLITHGSIPPENATPRKYGNFLILELLIASVIDELCKLIHLQLMFSRKAYSTKGILVRF